MTKSALSTDRYGGLIPKKASKSCDWEEIAVDIATDARIGFGGSGAGQRAVAALSEPLRKSLRHLTDNFAGPVRLSDLATLTGCTPFQIIRAFRKELGITPHALLIRIRVERGTALLARGESIAGVATEVGFVDQAHFTRHFKRMHATTPRRYLETRWAPQAA